MTVVAKNVQGSDAVAISIELFDLFLNKICINIDKKNNKKQKNIWY